jgi:seryl-tRNA synthetase
LKHASYITYELQLWRPGIKDFDKAASVSNYTDYKTRAAGVTLDNTQTHPYLIGGTLMHVESTLCLILENYLTPDGVRVPTILQQYMNGLCMIPFVKPEMSSAVV